MQLFVEGDWSQFDIEPRRNVIVTFTSQKIRRTKTGFLFGHVKLSSASELSDAGLEERWKDGVRVFLVLCGLRCDHRSD